MNRKSKALGRIAARSLLGAALLSFPACTSPAESPSPSVPEEQKPPAVPLGQTIWLKACKNQQYVATDHCLGGNAPLVASQTSVRDWERFQVLDAGEGQVALRAVDSGRYVTVNPRGQQVIATSTSLGTNERFQWVDLTTEGAGAIALKAQGSGRFVSAEGGASLYATRETPTCAESFTWGVAESVPASPAPEGWTQIWGDEFDRNCVNPSNWTPDNDVHVNNEQQQYTASARNISVSNGTLKLTAHEEALNGYPYTSGRLKSEGKREFTHARFEARLKLPVGAGLWPAFWLLGNDIGTKGWPACGELDIMENVGYAEWTSVALHGPGYSGNTPIVERFTLKSPVSDWHTYRTDVSAQDIQWFIDDVLVKTTTKADVNRYGTYVYDHPYFVLLNLAVGGIYPHGENKADTPYYGVPQATADLIRQTPQTLEVDWVRVYQRR